MPRRKRPTVADLDAMIAAMDDDAYRKLVRAGVGLVKQTIRETRFMLGDGDADNGRPYMSSVFVFERGRHGFLSFIRDLTTVTMATPGTLPNMLLQEARRRAKTDKSQVRKASKQFADEYKRLKAEGFRPDKRIAELMTQAGKDKYRGDGGYDNFKKTKRRCRDAGLL